jgi:hypothetical protein
VQFPLQQVQDAVQQVQLPVPKVQLLVPQVQGLAQERAQPSVLEPAERGQVSVPRQVSELRQVPAPAGVLRLLAALLALAHCWPLE